MAHFQADNAAAVPGLFDGSHPSPEAVLGWAGFLDARFILSSLGTLLLASVLGALIGSRASRRRARRGQRSGDAAHDRQAT